MSRNDNESIAHLLKHLAHSTSRRRLRLVDFALGEAPAVLGVVALHKEYVVERYIEQYSAVGGHTRLKGGD